jgi:hypothetical protein
MEERWNWNILKVTHIFSYNIPKGILSIAQPILLWHNQKNNKGDDGNE